GLRLAVEPMNDPMPGVVLLSTAPGNAPSPEGTISWNVLARLRGLDNEVFTDPHYSAQFYLGPDITNLKPVQHPVLIHQGAAHGNAELAGTITAGLTTVPEVSSGQPLWVQI